MHRIPAWLRVTLALAALSIVTVVLWVSSEIDTAVRLAAYATMLLAVGTVGLAAGAIGTYVEQRRASNAQAQELEEVQQQKLSARESDIAKVIIDRTSRPGEFLTVRVSNHSSRTIRQVYIWADIDSQPGHYHTIVYDRHDSDAERIMSHRMRAFRITQDGSQLYRNYRTIWPGEEVVFEQDRNNNDSPSPVLDVDDSWIKAYALFADADRTWWKCSEDGEVIRLEKPPTLVADDTLAPK
jgi:hypothetical protein